MDDPTPKISRRAALGRIGGGVLGAAVAPQLLGCDTSSGGAPSPDAGGTDATPGSGPTDALSSADAPGPAPALRPLRRDGSHPYDYIDTIVIVQMENRSFDHMLGSLTLEGRADVDGLRAGMTNPALDGSAVGIRHLADAWSIHPDPRHSHESSVDQFNGGANDGFIRSWEPLLHAGQRDTLLDVPMGYYTRSELPVTYGLADGFTVCDRWFCSLLGPTWPNRFYAAAATSDGHWVNRELLTSPTIFGRALAHGVSFGVYHAAPVFFSMLWTDPPLDTYPAKPLDQLFVDAAAGTLPNVTVVEPDYTLNDDHPPQDVRLGQAFIGSVYEALRTSPQWDRTLMVVFYDEHGGFFDHVAPPKVAGEARAGDGFDQLGFRIPGQLVGPLVRRGGVHSEVVDHASVPALISRIFDIPHLNERSRLAGDFAAAFDLELTLDANRPAPPQLPRVPVEMASMEEAFRRPFGQPELLARARSRGLAPAPHDPAAAARRAERWLRRLDQLGVAQIRS